MTIEAKTEEEQKRKAMFKKEEITKTEAYGSHDEPVHLNSMCDGCGVCPIVGARYKCLECDFRVSSLYFFTDDIMSSAALRALITTCARPVQRAIFTPPITVCS